MILRATGGGGAECAFRMRNVEFFKFFELRLIAMICKRCSDGAQDATARQEASDPIIHPHIQTQAKKSLLTYNMLLFV